MLDDKVIKQLYVFGLYWHMVVQNLFHSPCLHSNSPVKIISDKAKCRFYLKVSSLWLLLSKDTIHTRQQKFIAGAFFSIFDFGVNFSTRKDAFTTTFSLVRCPHLPNKVIYIYIYIYIYTGQPCLWKIDFLLNQKDQDFIISSGILYNQYGYY